MISKKTLFYVCLGGIVSFFILAFSKEIGFCPSDSYSLCLDLSNQFSEILLPLFPLTVFSLITYLMREDVYRAWFRFARWWIPLSMLSIFLAPEYSNNFLSPIEKGTIALLFSVLFVIISALIIGWKFIRK